MIIKRIITASIVVLILSCAQISISCTQPPIGYEVRYDDGLTETFRFDAARVYRLDRQADGNTTLTEIDLSKAPPRKQSHGE